MVGQHGDRLLSAETTYGPIEYGERGAGQPLLLIHGTPGGYDQGLALARVLALDGYRIISPSRPGYLGTSLAVGRDPLSQADACAGLLDALGIERLPVISLSGGGVIATMLALHYPQRVSRLLLLQSVTAKMDIAVDDALHAALLLPVSMRLAPSVLTETLKRREPYLLDAALDLARSTLPTVRRRVGVINDSLQIDALAPVPFREIAAPTLLVHGTADLNVPYQQSVDAAAALPDARLLTVPGGNHSSVLFKRHVVEAVKDFLRRD